MKKWNLLLILVACGCQSFKDSDLGAERSSSPVLLNTALLREMQLTSLTSLKAFYDGRSARLFWVDKGLRRPEADSLLALIRDAAVFGLKAQDYHVDAILDVLQDTLSDDKAMLADALLTDAFLTFHHHLRKGRLDPKTLQRRDISLEQDLEATAALARIEDGSISHEMRLAEPQNEQYQRLKRVIKAYTFASPGDSAAQRRGRTIALNLERWRWEKQWPDRYVLVNIPAFALYVVEADSVWLTTPVVVGKRKTPTPVLESVIRSFTIYPYWHVPHSISTGEILPSLQADPSYLRRNNFDVLYRGGSVLNADTIQWKRYSPVDVSFHTQAAGRQRKFHGHHQIQLCQ